MINIKNKLELKDNLVYHPPRGGEESLPIQLDPSEMYPPHPIGTDTAEGGRIVKSCYNLADISTIASVNGVPTGPPANLGWSWTAWDYLRIHYNFPYYYFLADLGDDYHLDYAYIWCDGVQEGPILAKTALGEWQNIGDYNTPYSSGGSWTRVEFYGEGRGGARYVKVGNYSVTGNIRGIVFYGRRIKGSILKGHKLKKLTVNRPINTMIGTNGFYFEDADMVSHVSENSRFYSLGWWITEGVFGSQNDGANFVKLEDQEINLSSSSMGNLDIQLQAYANTNQRVIIAFNNFLPYLMPFWQGDTIATPVDPGKNRYSLADTTNPHNYKHMARCAYVIAARYGANPDADMTGIKLPQRETPRVGLNILTALEFGNEIDASWISDDRTNPQEHAALMSALYDGHMGTMGPQMGVKAADPSMLLSLGALSFPETTTYVHEMKMWWDTHRGEGNYPMDIINYHYYNSTGSSQREEGNIVGVPPEKGSFLEFTRMWSIYRDKYMPFAEIWCTETGYDEHYGGMHSPKDRSAFARARHKSWWLIRIMLTSAAYDIDATNQYWFSNVGEPNLDEIGDDFNPSLFISSQYVEGSVEGNAFYGRRPLMSYWYMRAFKSGMQGFYFVHNILNNGEIRTKDHVIDFKGNPLAWALAFKNYHTNESCIAVWLGEEDFETDTFDIVVAEDETTVEVGNFIDAEILELTNVVKTTYPTTIKNGKRVVSVPVDGLVKLVYTKNLGIKKPVEPYDIKYQKLDNNKTHIVWTDENREDNQVWIQRSLDPLNNFVTIYTGVLLQPEYIDENTNNQNWFYRVTYEDAGNPPPPDDELEPKTPPLVVGAGTGGSLTIDGNSPQFNGMDNIVLKSGRYSYVTIRNFYGTADSPIFIRNEANGVVDVTGYILLEDSAYLRVQGDHNPSVPLGIRFDDPTERSFYLNENLHNITIKSLSFKDVSQYCIYNGGENVQYTGDPKTYISNLRILNCKFDGCATAWLRGKFSATEDRGFIDGLEIAHCEIVNSSGGYMFHVENVRNYDIHHNKAENINANNNNHNAIFILAGNGIFHDNYFRNYQGNAIRAWVFTRGTIPATILIYNNVCYETRKYGGFEIQYFSDFNVPGKATYVNAEIFNNTVGGLNRNNDWSGLFVDLYSTGPSSGDGTVTFYNNLGFDLKDASITTITEANMINNMSGKVVIRNNNKYEALASNAVEDLVNFKSKFPGVGATLLG